MAKTSTGTSKQRESILAGLKSLLGKVPKSAGDWSYNRSVDFKETHAKAVRAVASPRSTPEALSTALKELEGFYQ